MNTVSIMGIGVENANTELIQVSEELLKRYWRYSGWNLHLQLRFRVRTTKHAMERTNRSKLSSHLHSAFFPCRMQTGDER